MVSVGALVITVSGCVVSGVGISGGGIVGDSRGVMDLELQVTLARISQTRHKLNSIPRLLVVFIS